MKEGFVTALKKMYWRMRSGAHENVSIPAWNGDSGQYWEARYAHGGNSGDGSYGVLAQFKAEILNDFVAQQGIASVIEFGCGDGSQLGLAKYPEYIGYDISDTVIAGCRQRYAADPSKTFHTVDEYDGRQADLVLSLDVIYHLVEDSVFEAYMQRLFAAANRFVIVYSSNGTELNRDGIDHVRHRTFTDWISQHQPDWKLVEHIPNRYPYREDRLQDTSFADFYIFSRSV